MSLAWTESVLRFVQLLREAGLRVSPPEVMEALLALEVLPLLDREAVRAGLKATLVKEAQAVPVFERAFRSFFALPEARQAMEENLSRRREEEKARLEQAETDLAFRERPLDLSREEKLLYSRLDPARQAALRDFLQRTEHGKNVEENFRPMLENLVRGHLDYWRRRLEGGEDLPELPSSGDEELDVLLYDMAGQAAREYARLAYTDMKDIRTEDLPRAAHIVRQLSRRLATRLARRYRRSRKAAAVDIRRSIRRNLRYGGTLLELQYRRRRIHKPRLLVICDVSGSMARYATFVLQFIYGLAGITGRIESFVFAEDLERVTPFFRRQRDFNATMQEVMGYSQVWGEGTNLARALENLLANYRDLPGRDTVVIIISDTKTVTPERAAVALRRLRERTRGILWLNTLPEEEWPRHHTVEIMARESRMFQCNTLADLERILRVHLV